MGAVAFAGCGLDCLSEEWMCECSGSSEVEWEWENGWIGVEEERCEEQSGESARGERATMRWQDLEWQ